MPPKSRLSSSKSGRSSSAKKAAKPTGAAIRNITRWSANKDIVLLCALAKECRRDKFQPSWDRVAKWVGPNITGAAVEQHIGKLYSKLGQHRAVNEPKPKRKRGEAADNSQDDYVLDEDAWGKGNEALANIFYDKPGPNSLPMQETSDDELEKVAELEQLPRKRAATGKSKVAKKQDDDDEYLQGNPNELLLAGTKYLGASLKKEDTDDAEGLYHLSGTNAGGNEAGMVGFGFSGAGDGLVAHSGNVAAFEDVNALGEPVDLPGPRSMNPAVPDYSRRPLSFDESIPSSQQTIPNSIALSSDPAESSSLNPRLRHVEGYGNSESSMQQFYSPHMPPMPSTSDMPTQQGNAQRPGWMTNSEGMPPPGPMTQLPFRSRQGQSDRTTPLRSNHQDVPHHNFDPSEMHFFSPIATPTPYNMFSNGPPADGHHRGEHRNYSQAGLCGVTMPQVTRGQYLRRAMPSGVDRASRSLFPGAPNTGIFDGNSLQPHPAYKPTADSKFSTFAQFSSSPIPSRPYAIVGGLQRDDSEGLSFRMANAPARGQLEWMPNDAENNGEGSASRALVRRSASISGSVAPAALAGVSEGRDEVVKEENGAGNESAFDDWRYVGNMEDSPE